MWWSALVGAFFICSTILGIVGFVCLFLSNRRLNFVFSFFSNFAVIVAIAGDQVMRRSAMNLLLLNLVCLRERRNHIEDESNRRFSGDRRHVQSNDYSR